MEDIIYFKYTKKEMLEIIQNEPFLFVETSLNDFYIIKKRDLIDFIISESYRTGHIAKMNFYFPGIDDPILITYGWYIHSINPILKDEIIKPLIFSQNIKRKLKKIKVFDIDIFNNMSAQELGIKNGKINNFDKYYKKYCMNSKIEIN